MHSGRMPTARRLTVSGGGGGFCLRGGDLPSGESAFPWYCGKADGPMNRHTAVKTLPSRNFV